MAVLVLMLMGWLRGAGAAERVLFAPDFSRGIPAGWEQVTFFTKPTDYSAGREGTNGFLHASAVNGCSALSVQLDLKPAGGLKLRWRWRIAGVATNGSERVLAKFDHAARVFVAFDTFIGPPDTVNYVWGNAEPVGTLVEHPKSGRAQLFVVESGNGRAGQWVTEERDVAADWRRAFPGKKMPKVVGFGVMTDSDSLGGKLTGDYAEIRLTGE